jgi:hypothetical protein
MVMIPYIPSIATLRVISILIEIIPGNDKDKGLKGKEKV